MTETAAPGAETLEFKSELKQILEIITHSLYSHKEVFLRELISNASDAIDRARFLSLTGVGAEGEAGDWKITLAPDKDAGTLTVSDNGVGMSREEVVENLGTIARSGTRAFLESLRKAEAKDRPELIGQFGVGFYSAFMVADRVTVVSRRAGEASVRWESDGQGRFTVEAHDRPARGTDVTLHLKEDEKELLEPWRLRQLVKRFSDYVEHPIVLASEDKEAINSRKAVWLRPKSEVTAEEYEAFYKQVSSDDEAPAKVIHYTGEGAVEFKVLLFLPAHKTPDLQWGEAKAGPRLYIRRVLVMDRCEALLPPYLRFVRGVVDCADLPLNVSREMLQQNPLLERIQKNVVKNVLKALEEMKTSAYEAYVRMFRELGSILKEGVARDFTNREAVADLLLFESLRTERGKLTTLSEYVEKMPAGQEEIVYLTGESRQQIENAPYLEVFKERGWDVLLLTDPIDELVLPSLGEYRSKKLKAADRGDLPKSAAEEAASAEEEARFAPLLKLLETKLEVQAVRLSKRLKESAACLVVADDAMGANLERLLERAGRADEVEPSRRILELNAAHPAVEALRRLHESAPDDPRVEGYARLLHDEAVVAEGSRIADPAAFARRINELLIRDAGAA